MTNYWVARAREVGHYPCLVSMAAQRSKIDTADFRAVVIDENYQRLLPVAAQCPGEPGTADWYINAVRTIEANVYAPGAWDGTVEDLEIEVTKQVMDRLDNFLCHTCRGFDRPTIGEVCQACFTELEN